MAPHTTARHETCLGPSSEPFPQKTPPCRVTCHTTLRSVTRHCDQSRDYVNHRTQPVNYISEHLLIRFHATHSFLFFILTTSQMREIHQNNHHTGERSSPHPSSEPFPQKTPPYRVTYHTTLRSVTRHCGQSRDIAVSHATLRSVTRHCDQSHDIAISHATLRSVTRHCDQSRDTAISHATLRSVTRHCGPPF